MTFHLKPAIINLSNEREVIKMQRAIYKRIKTTRGYWFDFMSAKDMKKWAKREIRRKNKVK